MSLTRKEVIAKGYTVYCLECAKVYKVAPMRDYDDGHGGRQTDSCNRCGCDLFANLEDDTPC